VKKGEWAARERLHRRRSEQEIWYAKGEHGTFRQMGIREKGSMKKPKTLDADWKTSSVGTLPNSDVCRDKAPSLASCEGVTVIKHLGIGYNLGAGTPMPSKRHGSEHDERSVGAALMQPSKMLREGDAGTLRQGR